MASRPEVDIIDWPSVIAEATAKHELVNRRLFLLPIVYFAIFIAPILMVLVPPFSDWLSSETTHSFPRGGALAIALGTALTIRHLVFVGRVRQFLQDVAKPELTLWGPSNQNVHKNPNRTALDDEAELERSRATGEAGLDASTHALFEKVLMSEALIIVAGTLVWGFGDLLGI